uniref:Uncharacterized protein n=1 Tax=Candidatus Kentrum sp. LFY TaxID=2126342 RepID=A0A450UYG8_9GAMM|nr:MAG: hypothetical protein BECKLFY1418B_GA0070995_11049 [Candidatus Kentron sp. LFY]VFK00257.1 MAG: hypothetical protein BECKLFY1418A_GA0070994_11148 [Candidatus Kentron sp. LFY]
MIRLLPGFQPGNMDRGNAGSGKGSYACTWEPVEPAFHETDPSGNAERKINKGILASPLDYRQHFAKDREPSARATAR